MANQLCEAWDALRKPDVEFLARRAREYLVMDVRGQLRRVKKVPGYDPRPLREFLEYVDKNP